MRGEPEVILDLETVPFFEAGPRHLNENHERRWKLRRWGNMTAAYYGVPVYLVGSALRDDNPEPRDWDIRVTLPRFDFDCRYGDPNAWEAESLTGLWTAVRWRWAADCVHQTRDAWMNVHLNVDFQTQPPGTWNRYLDRPRLRIDSMPGLTEAQ